ncbi:hypothetical protein C9374_002184 [Naegleria lovaniensis]|uniref:Transmembrane protein n=1 Tax=Naegleria lovaniensis TaxID=51637 RepID=A0AA88KK69_NAELO|nr:uncharacterized protein C9374_002184 [Naegleria lovaniensis]KAG2386440.1 hypothetical protein C9374_002184 [Naegleria lovaniensis]
MSLLLRTSLLLLGIIILLATLSHTLAHDGHTHLDFVIDYPMVENGTIIPLDPVEYTQDEIIIRFQLYRIPVGGDDSKRFFVKFLRNDTNPYFLTFDTSNTTSISNCMRFRTRVGAAPRPERPSPLVYETYTNSTSLPIHVGSCDFYIEVKPGFYDPKQTNSESKCVVSLVLGKATCDSTCQNNMKTTCEAELNYEARVNHAAMTTNATGIFFAMTLLMILSFLMSF